MSVPQETPVVIIGGGEVGLATSILLSLQNISHVLFERQPSTSPFPKAIGLHNRTMEIFRQMGVEEEVLKQAAPPEICCRIGWFTSFGPEGRTIESREAVGYTMSDGERGEAYRKVSPSRYSNFAQIRLEPLLRRRAEELNPRGIFFHHEVTAISEASNHAIITYHHRSGPDQDETKTIKATYIIAADGGRFTPSHLNIPYEGESDILDMVTAHLRTPLSLHLPDSRNLLNWFINPRLGGSVNSGMAYHLGPYPRNPETEEWSFLVGRLPHEREKPFTKEDMLKRVRQTLCVPGLEIEVLSISHWYLQAKAAREYVSPRRRVFLVGDAAHRIPPWGALGGNAGFQDAHNLVWKLALALKPPPSLKDLDLAPLLQSYHTERHPIGVHVAQTAIANMRAHGNALDTALGLDPSASPSTNIAAMEDYFHALDSGTASAKVKAVHKAVHETLDIEFFALGAEAGWFYDMSDVVDNEVWRSPQINGDGSVEICEFRGTTMPGHQMPHAWLSNEAEEKMSTRWLYKQDKFVLVAGEAGWKVVGSEMVEVVVIGDEWKDVEGEWARQREVGASGAVLVRSDNIVAWRWMDDELLKDEDEEARCEIKRVMRRALRLE